MHISQGLITSFKVLVCYNITFFVIWYSYELHNVVDDFNVLGIKQ